MAHEAVQVAKVGSFYGEPADVRSAMVSPQGLELRVAPNHDSITPYKGEPERNPKKCHADDDTCNGWRAKGTPYCIGHLKSMAKAQREEREGE